MKNYHPGNKGDEKGGVHSPAGRLGDSQGCKENADAFKGGSKNGGHSIGSGGMSKSTSKGSHGSSY